MTEKEPDIQTLKSTQGENYGLLKGTFKEEEFNGLLDELNFKSSVLSRALLRVQLKEEGFFEGNKGEYIVRISFI